MPSQEYAATQHAILQPSQEIQCCLFRQGRWRRALDEGRRLVADSSQHVMLNTICVRPTTCIDLERTQTLGELLSNHID